MPEIETQRLDGYRRLIEIARDLASTLDLDELLRRIVFAAAEITDAMAGSILLYDSTSRQLFFQVSTNMDQSTMRGLAVPLEGSIAGWIVTNRKPARINNPHDDPRFFPQIEQSTGFSNKSMLGVPLITKEKVVGVLEVLNRNNGDFSDGDENLLRVLGAQAAVAIENARLFQQSDLISEFVHELRTPLASLSAAAYLLRRPEISQEQREQIVTNIHNETLRLSAMTSTFLDLARLESGRVQFHKSNFNFGDLLHECRSVMQSKADEMNIQIKVELAENIPFIDADRDKIKQALLNLISNAIKYNRPNGSVILRADSSADEVFAAVQDTGLGIPEDALPHLFEKFYRVREHEGVAAGTGLGLSICRQIVQGHNGALEVKSKPGVGTVFLLRLPRHSKITTR